MRIAIATNDIYPNLTGGETLLLEAFRSIGVSAESTVWDDPTIDWSQYDTVILRACWGYHQKIPEFLTWIQTLEDLRIDVQNSPDIIRWNAHKKYLLDLAERGVHVPRTRFIEKGNSDSLESIVASLEDNEFVIKPCYGAAAFGILRTSKQCTPEDEKAYQTLLQNSDVLIQTFVPAVQYGEVSAIFIGNTFSHTVIKIPKTGDFRSNFEYGGKEKVIQLSPQNITQLESIYSKCRVDTLYARLDVIVDKDDITVIELELIEPYLFFEYGEGSADRFVQALIERTSTK